jgi:hypothetical protein
MRYLPTFLVFTLAACSGGSSGPVYDAAVYDVDVELPDGCPPAEGNEKGIGITCTQGGGECMRAGMPPDLRCTCDPAFGIQLTGVPCVCTLVGINPDPATVQDACTLLQSGYCGSEATCCPYMNVGYFCSPNICLPDGQCIVFTDGPGT